MNRKNKTEKRKIALFDIDKTLFDGYILFPLLDLQLEAGTISQEAYDAIQKIYGTYKLREINYEDFARKSLVEWAAALQGIPTHVVLEQTIKLLDKKFTQFYPFVASLMKTFWPTHDLHLVTGEPSFVAGTVQKMVGADAYTATEFETQNDIFTGRVSRFLASRQDKRTALAQIADTHDLTGSFAFGDSDGDVQMLEMVENPICVNPTGELKEIAAQHHWTIVTPENLLATVKRKL